MGASSDDRKRVIVIGAGVGGLATAARLAKAGVHVTVVEKNAYSGGRCSLLEKDGFRFDRGPSFYLMPEIFEALFDDLGHQVKDWYELYKCEPNYIIHYDDGEQVKLSTDMPTMKQEIERWEGSGGWARFLAFMDESRQHYEMSVGQVLSKNFPSLLGLLRPRYLIMALKLHVFDILHRRASKYFWSERLRRAFTFSSMYLGMSPFNSPATYSLLQYTELAQGIWYPVGGFHRLPDALHRIAESLGATFRFSTPVKEILLDDSGRHAKGVRLESGEVIEADAVVCNADLVWAYTHLLPPTPYSRHLSKSSQLTCSSISFYWGLSRPLPSLSPHQLFLAEDYRGSFDRIFNDKVLPHEPSFYVHCPSRMDPSCAPAGKECVVVLVPVGHLVDDSEGAGMNVEVSQTGETPRFKRSQDWPALVEHARSYVLETLSKRLPPEAGVGPEKGGFEALIETEEVATPLTWKDELNLHKGSILGLSHGIFQVLCFRPRIRHDTIKSLFFVGASTHPGTGVPIVAAGSKLTAEDVLADFGVIPPWSHPRPAPVTVSQRAAELNAIRPPSRLHLENLFMWLLAPGLMAAIAFVAVARLGGL